jgi:hypothetical protein
VLDRVPDGVFSWKPHDKSMTLGRLAEHLAELPAWMKNAIVDSGIDMATGRPDGYQSPPTRAAVLPAAHGSDRRVAVFAVPRSAFPGREASTGHTRAVLRTPFSPHEPASSVASTVYWQEAQFGLKPTTRINHLVIRGSEEDTIVASKML